MKVQCAAVLRMEDKRVDVLKWIKGMNTERPLNLFPEDSFWPTPCEL